MTGRIISLTAAAVVLFSMSLLLMRNPAPPAPLSNPQAAANAIPHTDYRDYIWPTDARAKMTSSFAEFRRTHFHGGIDIGTGSTTGYKVFAMRDGYVSRIRVSPTGYGKMVFVRHADGFTSTYAHLSGFSAQLTGRVTQEQLRRECFAVDLECAPGEFPVKKGEVIAYTGESGVGTPHLHFEIRDPEGDFVNPLLCDSLAFHDTAPPLVRRIAVRPLGEDSRVDGAWRPRVYGVRRGPHGTLKIDGTIHVTGRAGIAVDARDITNGSGFRHGVYGFDLFLDDSLVHRHRLDRAPANASQQIMLYYDWELLAQGKGRFEKLYAAEPHDLPFYEPAGNGSGVITTAALASGEHDLRIVVFDFSGNTTEVRGTLISNHAPEFSLEQQANDYRIVFDPREDITRFVVSMKHAGSGEWKVKTLFPDSSSRAHGFTLPHPGGSITVAQVVAENSFGTRSAPGFLWFRQEQGATAALRMECEIEREFVRVNLTSAGDFTAPPTITVYEGETKRVIPAQAVALDRYIADFRPLVHYSGMRRVVAQARINGHPSSANREFDLYPIVAGDSGTVIMDGGNLVIRYGPTSLYSTEFLQVRKETRGNEVSYVFTPDYVVLRDGFTVSARVPRPGPHMALFATGFGSGEELIAPAREDGGAVLTGIVTRTIGTVSVLQDANPPSIARLHIAAGRDRRPAITFRYGDDLSGVDYSEFKMYIDGQIAIPEIDGEHHRAYHHVTAPLPRGSHLLLLRIKDRLGNASEVERRFTVR
jgi:hypothetical protein